MPRRRSQELAAQCSASCFFQQARLVARPPKACPLGCRSLVHGGPEADASLRHLTVRGVVQFEAAMVEELAACCQRHKVRSLLALHAVSCYPTRLISPAAQRRAMSSLCTWDPDRDGGAGVLAVAVGTPGSANQCSKPTTTVQSMAIIENFGATHANQA